MYLARRPSTAQIDCFLARSRRLTLSYGPIGLARETPIHRRFDEQIVVIGHGPADFERARASLASWQHFAVGWVEIFPRQPSIDPDTVAAVLIRHLGFWSLNGTRVLYQVHPTGSRARFGFAYGTLTNHAESGEELFEVFIDEQTGDVMYRIRAVSWPQTMLAFIGQPIVRVLQARFRRDSAAAMVRATASPSLVSSR